jgi:hypothetical protein
MVSNKQTIALSTVAVAVAIVLFAAGPLVATHQAQAFWGGGCGFPGWGWGGGFGGPFFGHFGHFGGGHFGGGHF